MSLPRIRFKLRSLMVATAVVAVAISGALWALKMRRLSKDLASVAQRRTQLETQYKLWAARSRQSAEEWEQKRPDRSDSIEKEFSSLSSKQVALGTSLILVSTIFLSMTLLVALIAYLRRPMRKYSPALAELPKPEPKQGGRESVG